ncbi:MAG: ferritin-like domain-containing protein [Promethearchaeota archaeon]
MASRKLLDLLNKGIARELRVSVEYMWNHVRIAGMESEAHGGIFKKIAITEMKHAENIAERLDYIGGEPTTEPDPITIGKTPREMFQIALEAEEGAIKLYRTIIKQADEEEDFVTRSLFEGILADEEDHHNVFLKHLKK